MSNDKKQYKKMRVGSEKFIAEYMLHNNAVLAYMRAFDSTHLNAVGNSSHYLNRADVQDALALERAKFAADNNIQKETILKELLSIAEDSRASGKDGIAIKALTQISKMLGFDAAVKSEVSIEGLPISINLNLGDDEKPKNK